MPLKALEAQQRTRHQQEVNESIKRNRQKMMDTRQKQDVNNSKQKRTRHRMKGKKDQIDALKHRKE